MKSWRWAWLHFGTMRENKSLRFSQFGFTDINSADGNVWMSRTTGSAANLSSNDVFLKADPDVSSALRSLHRFPKIPSACFSPRSVSLETFRTKNFGRLWSEPPSQTLVGKALKCSVLCWLKTFCFWRMKFYVYIWGLCKWCFSFRARAALNSLFLCAKLWDQRRRRPVEAGQHRSPVVSHTERRVNAAPHFLHIDAIFDSRWQEKLLHNFLLLLLVKTTLYHVSKVE